MAGTTFLKNASLSRMVSVRDGLALKMSRKGCSARLPASSSAKSRISAVSFTSHGSE
jgi:hypothetical protein